MGQKALQYPPKEAKKPEPPPVPPKNNFSKKIYLQPEIAYDVLYQRTENLAKDILELRKQLNSLFITEEKRFVELKKLTEECIQLLEEKIRGR